MTVTVMIPTRDRCQDLRRTCFKLKALCPLPDEVLIWADGCTDGTAAMVRGEFPQFTLLESSKSMGSVYGRDRMLRLARGNIVLSLDDDSYPLQRDFIDRLRQAFAQHPEAAVIVFAELREGKKHAAHNRAQTSLGHYVSAYANCAAAMRREFYLRQPGFESFFGHMYEEPDYALQCYAAGAAVWFEPTLLVRHRESRVGRSPIARHHLNARNELWSVWMRCPWPLVTPVSVYRVARQFMYACSEGWRWASEEPRWWVWALGGWSNCWRARRPVRWKVYAYWMQLARRPVFSADQLMSKFPRL